MPRRNRTYHVKTGNPKLAQKNRDERRGSSNSRGYGARWQKHRKIFLAQYPFCVACPKKPTRAELIDHIIPVRQGDTPQSGEADPLFWAVWNHQPLCRMHHSIKSNLKDVEIIASRNWLLNRLTEDDDAARRQQLILLTGMWEEWLDLRTGDIVSPN